MKFNHKLTINLLLLVLLASLTAACSAAKSTVKQEYSKDDLTFSHFSDWKITEDNTTQEAVGAVRFISIEGPDDSILMISRFPGEADVTLESYVEMLQKGMSEEAKTMTGGVEIIKMDAGKLTPVESRIAGIARRGLAREFDIKALNFPVPHRAENFLIENENEKWFLVAQSPKENWEGVKSGFQIIYDTFQIGQTSAESGGKSSPQSK